MNIKEVKRPWIKKTQRRYNPDPYYQSNDWRMRRLNFRQGYTELEGIKVSNKLCLECFKSGSIVEGKHTDHIVARKAGGSDNDNNLQTLCDYHHASKSANEGK